MQNKFSQPIHADEDAYYMSTPEVVAAHLAKQLADYGTAVELCCAVGVTTIQLALYLDHVYGIDLDEMRLDDARYNAELYGASDKVIFIHGDVLDEKLLETIPAAVAVLDPDWSASGSPSKSDHVADMDSTQPSMRQMIDLVRKYITHNIVARVPKTFTREILEEMGPCRVENIIWGDKLRFRIVYYLEGITKYTETDIVFDI